MSSCKLEVSGDVLVINSPFKRGFVEGLKTIIPGGERYWDRDEKVWEVNPDYLDEVIHLAQRFFTDVFVDEVEEVGTVERGQGASKETIMIGLLQDHVKKLKLRIANLEAKENNNKEIGNWGQLRKFVNNKDLHKLHKALALTHHPDKGGDEAKMKVVNGLMDNLKGK